MKTWIKWKYLRTLALLKRKSRVFEKGKMDDIQKLIFNISLKLIENPNSELRSNSIDLTYQIENGDYLIVIRQNSVNLMEYKNRQIINNFDVYFDIDDIKMIVSNYETEIHKRMNDKVLLRTTKLVKHLQSVLDNIEK
jgi:hypothetical protein